ncbi:cysteine dioxygenase family protein [Nostoc sp. UCD121]|uniref:cysteine dioxygenase family protein n=1 Tax=unclassified Nostoc TaxID=2593658 RepID=UPI001627A1B5|nr:MULTISPECIES: cysteine dioxygenase family protein [unclassified Nostoc]MBC1224642.1 cysteine dioxygenase family protein [Nostoc sp. UCD120]MBC1277147.1 cysteine dioxygenase family protein [Nostoc sp. UCD121]MBC1294891.1 cysteine dioxygenase family protein [Nostoc sp. UCD122]
MTNDTILEPLPEDQWFIESQELRSFVATVREISAIPAGDRTQTLTRLEPYFQELLAQQEWLSEKFAQINPESKMGGGIGQWLLYRAKDRSLSVFSLVIPPGSTTPVHDHLAWGLIGLYKGNQEETVYRRVDNGDTEGHAQLQVTEVRSLQPGDIYRLLPPDGDIHAVKTTSQSASVSIHILGNDTGCILRHQFIPESDSVKSFRSGYSNAPCKEEEEKEHVQV